MIEDRLVVKTNILKSEMVLWRNKMNIFNIISEYYWFGYFSCFVVAILYQWKYYKENYHSVETPIILSEHDDDGLELSIVIFSSLLWFIAIPVYLCLILIMYWRN